MIRTAFAILALAVTSACTLILPTEDLIKPCKESAECDEGFECQENACLPIDEEAAAEGEGEGE
jgi:hypothetical protein